MCVVERSNTTQNTIVLILVLLAFCIFFLSTIHGIGVSRDGLKYTLAAFNLADGNGYVLGPDLSGSLVAVTHYPPLYSTMLALPRLIGLDVLEAARWIHAGLFLALVWLYLVSLRRIVGLSFFMLSFFGILFVLSEAFLPFSNRISTELPFLFCCLTTWLLLDDYMRKRAVRPLVLGAIACGAAFLTRYAGLSLVVAGIVVICWRGAGLRTRIFHSSLFGLISCTPTAFFVLRNLIETETLTNREFSVEPISWADFLHLSQTVLSWIFPVERVLIRTPVSLLFLSMVVLICGISWPLWRNSDRIKCPTRLPFIISIFTVVYIPFILLSRAFFDHLIPINSRILCPVAVCLFLLGAYSLSASESGLFTRSPLRWLLGFWAILLILVHAVAISNHIRDGVNRGIGYNQLRFQQSPVMEKVRGLPWSTVVFSNEPRVIRLHVLREAHYLGELDLHGPSTDSVVVFWSGISPSPEAYLPLDHFEWEQDRNEDVLVCISGR